jgi:hypothetical protein
MTTQLLGSTVAFFAAVFPLIVLTAIALVGNMVGEWGRGALLAYAAVLLGFLGGAGAAGSTATSIQFLGGTGVFIAVVALSLGGPAGLAVLALAYGLSTALVLVRPNSGAPWLLLAIAGTVCLVVALRYRF